MNFSLMRNSIIDIFFSKKSKYVKKNIYYTKTSMQNQGNLGAQFFIAIDKILLPRCSNLNENYAHTNKNFYECT